MALKKFKKITNRYIEHQRNKLVYKILEELSKSNERKKILNKSSLKLQYLGKLSLYDLSQIDNTYSTMKLKNLTCNEKWPVCMFDHTRKFRCPTYFSFCVSKESYEIIDDYFTAKTNRKISTSKKPLSPRPTGYTLVELKSCSPKYYDLFIQSSNEFKLDEIKKEEKKQKTIPKNENFDNLLIERNLHYCNNENFTKIINFGLNLEKDHPNIFSHSYINLPITEEYKYMKLMENYTNHLVNSKEILQEALNWSESSSPKIEKKAIALENQNENFVEIISENIGEIKNNEVVKNSPSGHFLANLLQQNNTNFN